MDRQTDTPTFGIIEAPVPELEKRLFTSKPDEEKPFIWSYQFKYVFSSKPNWEFLRNFPLFSIDASPANTFLPCHQQGTLLVVLVLFSK